MNDYNPDAIRYFFIANGPEKRDADFSFREFKTQNNSELVGAWGNFVNRTLAFSVKYLNSEIAETTIDEKIRTKVIDSFDSVGEKIEKGCFRDATEEIFELIRFGNAYYDSKQPWKTRTDDVAECRKTIAECAYLIANIAVLLYPILPFSSEKIADWLDVNLTWQEKTVTLKQITKEISILFQRIE